MTAVVLAAGKSKRMGSKVPKVLLEVCGRPLVAYVVDAARAAGAERVIIVVGQGQDQVRHAVGSNGLEFAVQVDQRGTADALLACRDRLRDEDEVVVLYGDAPLITGRTVRRLCATRAETGADVAVFTARLTDPADYGRVIRLGGDDIDRIVEKRDATEAELMVNEVNSGLYSFCWGRVRSALERIKPSPGTGEYYLTDLVQEIRAEGGRVVAVLAEDPNEMLGANTPEELARIEAELGRRRFGSG